MTKIECQCLAKLDIINSMLMYLENKKNDNLTIDDFIVKLKCSEIFYRNRLARLED